jgi:hypothetical protein
LNILPRTFKTFKNFIFFNKNYKIKIKNEVYPLFCIESAFNALEI